MTRDKVISLREMAYLQDTLTLLDELATGQMRRIDRNPRRF